jgi:hypothetical protein
MSDAPVGKPLGRRIRPTGRFKTPNRIIREKGLNVEPRASDKRS